MRVTILSLVLMLCLFAGGVAFAQAVPEDLPLPETTAGPQGMHSVSDGGMLDEGGLLYLVNRDKKAGASYQPDDLVVPNVPTRKKGMEDGIMLRKYWFSVSDKMQMKRFKSRLTDPMRRWKLSPTDLESLTRWEAYSRAKDEMFVHTDIPEARWNVVESEDKKRARLNMIAHLLSSVPYKKVEMPTLKLPKRPASTGYERTDRSLQFEVPDTTAGLVRGKRK